VENGQIRQAVVNLTILPIDVQSGDFTAHFAGNPGSLRIGTEIDCLPQKSQKNLFNENCHTAISIPGNEFFWAVGARMSHDLSGLAREANFRVYVEQKEAFENYKYFGALQNAAGNAISQTDATTRYGGSQNTPVTTRQIQAYSCPSDTISASPGIFSGITFHNYVANHGNTSLARTATFGTTLGGQPNTFKGAPFTQVASWNSTPQTVRYADILDGLSNTLAFSETVQGRANDLRGFAWWNGGAHFEGYLPPNSSQPDILEAIGYCIKTNPANPPCDGPTSTNPSNIAARSRHPKGVMAALCDGSVRFVSNSVNLDTWRNVSSAYGAEAVNDL
jgi:hypothetical protein